MRLTPDTIRNGKQAQRPGPDDVSADSGPAASAHVASPRRQGGSGFVERYVIVAALVVVIAVFSILKPDSFFTVDNLQTILTTQAALIVMALCLSLVLAAGDLDLSVAGVVGISSVLAAWFSAVLGLATWLSLLLSFLFAVVVGLTNAVLIVRIRVNALIITLAMGTLLDGISSAVTHSTTIGNIPSDLITIFSARFLGIGLPFWYTVGVGLILWYVMHHMPSGRYVYFTGEGREAARLVGIRVTRIRIVAFAVSAVGAWLAGVIILGQTGAAQAGVGGPYLLPVYASAFLGAATIRPGRFNPIGTFVGALLLAVGSTGLQLFGLNTWVTQVFSGSILIIAVSVAALARKDRTSES